MNQAPNFLIQLGEALGPVGSLLVVLLLLLGGAIYVGMAVRQNWKDHARIESKIDNGSARLGAEIASWREESREDSKETRAKIDAWGEETREELRSISSRLDQLIDRMPPDETG